MNHTLVKQYLVLTFGIMLLGWTSSLAALALTVFTSAIVLQISKKGGCI